MIEELLKYVLIIIILLPFGALVTEVRQKKQGKMILVAAIGAAVFSLLACYMIGGFHQRPRIANLYLLAFAFWSPALLLAKWLNPRMSWSVMWLSVLLMSWYLINVSMQFYYPVNGGGGGLGIFLGLALGWSYMVVPFALLSGLFLLVRRATRAT